MATGHGTPLFPQSPTSALPAIPVPSVASSYLPLKIPVQGSGCPSQELRLRIPPTSQTPPFQNLSGHPSANTPISTFIPHRPAFPTYGEVTPLPSIQMPATHIPAAHFDLTPPRRGITMPIPFRNHTHVAPGPYSRQAPIYGSHSRATQIPPDRQIYQDNSDFEKDGDDSDTSALNNGDTLPKSPYPPLIGELRPVRAQTLATPGLLADGTNGTPNSPSKSRGFFSRIRKKLVNRRHPLPNQTEEPETTVQLPQQATSRCRRCNKSFNVKSATDLSGFCCEVHMWSAIERGEATICPKCKGLACPEGQAFCSASCANM